MIDNTWDNYKPENGDYFKTNSIGAETLRKFAKHFDFYDVECLIEHCNSNPECCFKDSEFIGTEAEECYLREINITEILYHINKPKKVHNEGDVVIGGIYVFDHEDFQPKHRDFFDLRKHTPEQRQWLQDNLTTSCDSDFLGHWVTGGDAKWSLAVWGLGTFIGTNDSHSLNNEIHINDILV